MEQTNSWIARLAGDSINPAQVEHSLGELSKRWPADSPPLAGVVEGFPLGREALIHLLAISPVAGTRLIQQPEVLLWLQSDDVCTAARDNVQMAADLRNLVGEQSIALDNFRPLRLWKQRQMLRVALREVSEVASLEDTTAELSAIAEICLRAVLEHWDADLRQRYGSPDAGFAIFALGKLGGRELNYSSDVDLIFAYGDEGKLSAHLSYHEFFNRLANRILDTFNATHPDGSLFRVDLRLRPEGTAGPLARSLRSMEYYYSGYGETWERLALIKARGVAGSEELIYDFLRQHQPFIYPRIATPDLLEQIANIKTRIEREVVGAENLDRDVKLGRGGIREIEFVVQTMQFMHGSRNAFLQQTSTLGALRALAELELMPRKDIVDLDRAYRFLRQVEHRLQIEAEQQTHTVPDDPKSLGRLATSLGFESAETFAQTLHGHTAAVRAIFDHFVSPQKAAPTSDSRTIFADRVRADRALNELEHGSRTAHVSARTRQLSRKLRPLLLAALAQTADPDSTLNQFVRFAEAYGMRSMLFELLVSNPRLLELIAKTFDASRYGADLLVRRPQLLEDVTRRGRLDGNVSVAEHLEELSSLGTDADMDPIRAYRQAQLLRILLRDVLGLADLENVNLEHASLAEACLIRVGQLSGATDLTVIALGKFGGMEISYGADVDVLFIGSDSAVAQRIVAACAQTTAEGGLPRIDARLRPEGENGPLVAPLQTYAQYYAGRAQFWEFQALTRARGVTGPEQTEFIELARSAWRRAGDQPDLPANIDEMLGRIRRERGSGWEFRDLKTGTGGMVEAEFLVQALQMSANIWEPNWQRATERLVEEAQLSEADADILRRSYGFLRTIESILRRHDNTTVSALPNDTGTQRLLARRLGFETLDPFAERYVAARESIHGLYCRRIIRAPLVDPEQFQKLMQKPEGAN